MNAPLTKMQVRRLREVYRSAGWPSQDNLELELLTRGLLTRVLHATGHETLRVTDAGLVAIAAHIDNHRRSRGDHENLVDRVAQAMARDGRIVWTTLSLRAQVGVKDGDGGSAGIRWRVCKPDVFSIRNTTVRAYLHPVVHEVKVSRADLLGDLSNVDKRASYLDLGGQCWYVLGRNDKGQPIAQAHEVPDECGVLVWSDQRLQLLRAAPQRPVADLPFPVWMALAKAKPAAFDEPLGTAGLPAVDPD